MTRPNFTTNLSAQWSSSRPNGSFPTSGSVLDGQQAKEIVSGLARHKPTGWLTPTGYDMQWKYYRRALGICKNIVNPNDLSLGQIYEGCVGGSRFSSLDHFAFTVSTTDVTDATLSNRALIEARIKMKRSDVNLGVAYAERNATARLLGDTAKRMAKSFNNLKRGRVRAAMRDLGIANSRHEPRGSNVPNKWLELQYGWKPLLSDVFGACQALEREDRANWRVTAKARKESKRTWKKTFTGVEASDCEAESVTSVFVRIDALPDNDLTMSLASLGVTNPLLIAWELVPYSFVVDWALPVGSWLESLDSLLGYVESQTSISVRTRANWIDKGIYVKGVGGAFVDNKFEGIQRFVRLTRQAFIGVPQATFPRIKDPSSLGHMANGLALLASAFGRR
jgi:hypothetical protein